MSQENVERLRRVYAGINEGVDEPLQDLLHPEFVYKTREELPGGGSYPATDLLSRLAELREIFRDGRLEPEEFISSDHAVVVLVRSTGFGRVSGVPFDERIFHVWKIDNAKARELCVYSDRGDALAAAGLRSSAMPQENVELTYRAYDAFDRRDLDAFLTLMDDDVEAVPRMVDMEGGARGHDGIRRWWENWLDVFPDFSIEVVEVRDLGGDLTVGALHLRAHGAGSDTPIDETIGHVGRWRRGKCVWWKTFDTWAEALEAVGLSEQDAHADS